VSTDSFTDNSDESDHSDEELDEEEAAKERDLLRATFSDLPQPRVYEDRRDYGDPTHPEHPSYAAG